MARISCPNCSESFPNRWVSDVGNTGSGLPESKSALPASTTQPWSNRAVGLTILGIMLVSAGVGLAYALWSLPNRQGRHGKLPPHLVKPKLHTPATLPALGYLPRDCNVVVGVHVAELTHHKRGQEIIAGLRPLLERIKGWTGFDAKSIDHLAIGTRLSKSNLGTLTIVIQTRSPYEFELLQDKHSSFDMLKHNDRPLFRLKRELAVDGFLWCADPGTVVLVLRVDGVQRSDMDTVPAKPRSGSDRSPPAVADVIDSSRLSQRSLAWCVGRVPELTQLLPLGLLERALGPIVSRAKTIVVGVSIPENTPLTVEAAIEPKTYLDADKIERMLLTRESDKLKVIGPPSLASIVTAFLPARPIGVLSVAESAAQMTSMSAMLDRNGNWLTLQYRPGPQTIETWLRLAANPSNE